MKSVGFILAVTLFCQWTLAQEPRNTYLARCAEKSGPGRFDLTISKVMAPKKLCQTIIYIGGDKYESSCEYSSQGMYYVSGVTNRKVIFATWGVIKAQGGEIDLVDGFPKKAAYLCTLYGAQG